MFESFGFLPAVALFVMGLILVFVGFFLGHTTKNSSASASNFNKADWIILGADFALIAVATFFALHDNMAGFDRHPFWRVYIIELSISRLPELFAGVISK